MPTRAAAVRELLKRGLTAEGFLSAGVGENRRTSASSAGSRGDGSGGQRRASALARRSGRRRLRRLGQHLQAQPAGIALRSSPASLIVARRMSRL
jgi:hypothetical protein